MFQTMLVRSVSHIAPEQVRGRVMRSKMLHNGTVWLPDSAASQKSAEVWGRPGGGRGR